MLISRSKLSLLYSSRGALHDSKFKIILIYLELGP